MAMTVRTHRLPAASALLAAGLATGAAGGCSGAPAPGEAYRLVPGGDAQRGRLLLAHYQCGSCHAVPGVPGRSTQVGPTLAAFGGRSYIAGRVPNEAAALQRWLQSPQSLVPGTAMPHLGVSATDARDMAAYLMALR